MKAVRVEPKKPGTARLEEIPEPDAHDGSVLVEAVAVGVCGTDIEIVEGMYGWARPTRCWSWASATARATTTAARSIPA